MRVLIVGSGSREHALAWKLLQSPRLSRLYLTTRNASSVSLRDQFGAEKIAPLVTFDELDTPALVALAVQEKIDLVLIGSEAPLAAGLSDALLNAKIAVFGPSQGAAQIEASKAFSKAFMARHQIPTAHYAAFTDLTTALTYLHTLDYSVVIKASGLAAGKGVFLPDTREEASAILTALLTEGTLGAAGAEVIIEERLTGEEVSLLAFSDGHTVKAMPPARDHKRLLDHDQGPNTGGMGAYAPAVNLCPPALQAELTQTILQKTIDGLRTEGTLFVGVLYAGLMLTPVGPRVLEFNCRFGDPETQVLMTLLESDLIDVVEACVQGCLATQSVTWRAASAVCVVLAASGYPQQPRTGDTIHGLTLPQAENIAIFQAGTRLIDAQIVTNGGRVLSVTAWSEDLTTAVQTVYRTIPSINFDGMQYRLDIAQPQFSGT